MCVGTGALGAQANKREGSGGGGECGRLACGGGDHLGKKGSGG